MWMSLVVTMVALAPQAPQARPPPSSAPKKPAVAPANAPAVPAKSPNLGPAGGEKGPAAGEKPQPKVPVVPPPADESTADLTPEQLESRSLTTKALGLFRSNEFTKALELANKAHELDPKYETAARVLGWCAVVTGDDRKAEAILTRVLNMNPNDGELQYLLAVCHKRLGEWGAAKDLLTDLVKREGPTLRVLFEMGECCIGEEDFAGALAVYEHARQIAPKKREVVDKIVALHELQESWDLAAKELRSLIVLAPGDLPARARLAHVLVEAGKPADAATVLEEAATALPEDPEPHKLLEALYTGPFPDEARAQFHRNWLKERSARRR